MDEELERYVTALFAREDRALQDARTGHEAADLPAIHVSPLEGAILEVLLRAVGARTVLEIGTLGGYSGVWLARALGAGGKLVTLEADPAHAAYARRTFAQAGVQDRVTIKEGNALALLPDLSGPFDAVFLDADKAPLPDYFAEAMRLLRVGGLLLCDNTFLHGKVVGGDAVDPDVAGMRKFNELAAHDPRLVSAVIPVRDGLLTAVKVGS